MYNNIIIKPNYITSFNLSIAILVLFTILFIYNLNPYLSISKFISFIVPQQSGLKIFNLTHI